MMLCNVDLVDLAPDNVVVVAANLAVVEAVVPQVLLPHDSYRSVVVQQRWEFCVNQLGKPVVTGTEHG